MRLDNGGGGGGGGGSDPYWSNVVSLLHFDGGLTDEKGLSWSLYKAGIIDTTNPIFGTGSLSTTAQGGAVGPTERIDTNASFTIEGFVYCTDNTPLNFIYTSRHQGSNQSASTLYFGGGIPLSFQIFDASANLQQFTPSAGPFPINTVVHVAVTFDKATNTLRIFQGGQMVLEELVTRFWTKNKPAYLGCYPHTDHTSRYLRGRLDDWRETVGVARYTENFTPPTEPFPEG
jgi:hypothetical protein